MFRCMLLAGVALGLAQTGYAVDIVRNGQAVAEIVTAENPPPQRKDGGGGTAAARGSHVRGEAADC